MKKLAKQQIKHYVIVNLSYSLTHKLLKEKLYSQVIFNIVNDYIKDETLPIESLELTLTTEDISTLILEGFNWTTSKEGFQYWSKTYTKLANNEK